jgi:hypothetical protein
MNKTAAPLVMSAGQREALTVLARSPTAAHREVKRATVLLMAADGVASSKIAATVGVTRSRSARGGPGSLGVNTPTDTRSDNRRSETGFTHPERGMPPNYTVVSLT